MRDNDPLASFARASAVGEESGVIHVLGEENGEEGILTLWTASTL